MSATAVSASPPPPPPGSGIPASLTEDGFLGGRLRILQPEKGFRAGIDSVFLAASIPCAPGESVYLDAAALARLSVLAVCDAVRRQPHAAGDFCCPPGHHRRRAADSAALFLNGYIDFTGGNGLQLYSPSNRDCIR